MPTLTDIANALGINKTTVSKALHYSSDISRQTRDRVLAEAERQGYVKHQYRRRMDSGSGNLVGIVYSEELDPRYFKMITVLNRLLLKNGFESVAMLINASDDFESQQTKWLSRMDVCGIILLSQYSDTPTALDGIEGIPIVRMDMDRMDVNSGTAALIQHLSLFGHNSIAYIGNESNIRYLEAFRGNIAANGIPQYGEYELLNGEVGEKCGYDGMQRALRLEKAPTAVIAENDGVALGAYRALCERGLRVPDDVALAGIGDSEFCPYLPCSLTSVYCDYEGYCAAATADLMRQIRPELRLETRLKPSRIVVRESTARFCAK